MYRSASSLDEYNDESTREERIERLTLQNIAHAQTYQVNAQQIQQPQPQPSQRIVQYGTIAQLRKAQDYEQQYQPQQELAQERSNHAPADSSFEIHPLVAVTTAGIKENDVFSGPGCKMVNGHTKYHELLDSKKQLFASAVRQLEKTAISTSVVHELRALNPSGRFLKLDKRAEIQLWFDIGDLAARKKVGQALRDKKRYKSPLGEGKASKGGTKRKADAAIPVRDNQARSNANAVLRNWYNPLRESTNTKMISTPAQNITQTPAPQPEIGHSYNRTGTYSIRPDHYQSSLQHHQSAQQTMVARVPLVLPERREDQRITSLHQPIFAHAPFLSRAHLLSTKNVQHSALHYQVPQQIPVEAPFLYADPLPPTNNHQSLTSNDQPPQQRLGEELFLPEDPLLPPTNTHQPLISNHQSPQQGLGEDLFLHAAPLPPLNNDQCLAPHYPLYDPCISVAPLASLNNDLCLAPYRQRPQQTIKDLFSLTAPSPLVHIYHQVAPHHQPPQQMFVDDQCIPTAPLPLANNGQRLATHHQPLQQTIEVPSLPTSLSPYIDQHLEPHHQPPQHTNGDPRVHIAPLPLTNNDTPNPNLLTPPALNHHSTPTSDRSKVFFSVD
jgi:hypothetical protein